MLRKDFWKRICKTRKRHYIAGGQKNENYLVANFNSNVTVYLDLAGYVITRRYDGIDAAQIIVNKGNLIVDDSVGGGKINLVMNSGKRNTAMFLIYDGSLTINGGEYMIYHAGDENYSCSAIASQGGKTVVNDGLFKTNGHLIYFNGQVVVNGGTFASSYDGKFSSYKALMKNTGEKGSLEIHNIIINNNSKMNYTFTPESVYNKRVVLPSSSDAVICNYLQNGTYTENAFDIKSKVLEIYDFSGENLITSNPDSEHILASKSSEKTFTFSVSDNYGVKKGGLKYVIKADVYKDKSIVKSKSIKSNPLEVDQKFTEVGEYELDINAYFYSKVNASKPAAQKNMKVNVICGEAIIESSFVNSPTQIKFSENLQEIYDFYNKNQNKQALEFQWQRYIKTGMRSRWFNIKGAEDPTFTPPDNYEGKIIRAAVTSKYYSGTIYTNTVIVGKALNTSSPTLPTLSFNPGDYSHIILSGTKADQEYLAASTDSAPSDWTGAKTVEKDGDSLILDCAEGKNVFVHTRIKETAKQKASESKFGIIYAGRPTKATGIIIQSGGKTVEKLNISTGQIVKLASLPEPSDLDVWNGCRWYVLDGAGLYEDKECKTPIETDKVYKEVYLKAGDSAKENIKLGTELTVGYNEIISKNIMLNISSSHSHVFSENWKYDNNNHWHECDCGEKSDLSAHSFVEKIDKAATKTQSGLKHEECKICGFKKDAVIIPVIAEDTTKDQNTKPSEEKTTDTPVVKFTLGDVNFDGKVNATDARIALRISAKLESVEKYKTGAFNAADIDKNGKISALDARKILRVAAKLDKFE